jgi:predicted PurR-regulated permease PerM
LKSGAQEGILNVVPKRQSPWLGGRFHLDVRDPAPFENTRQFWRAMAQPATIVMCVLMFGVFLYVARALLLPVLCAVIVGMTFGPYLGYATKRGVPAWLLAILAVTVIIGGANIAVVLLANPATEMLRRVPEIAQAVKDKLQVFEQPMLAFENLRLALGSEHSEGGFDLNLARIVEGFFTIVTPVAVQFLLQLVLFIGTLFFFIVGRASFRSHAVNLFATRDARLRALKILNDVETNLSSYLIVVSGINVCLGLVTIAVTYVMGMPYPLLWGALAFALNYVPYVGPSIMYLLLFLVGVQTYPTLLGALGPPAVFVGITLIEGQFLTPAIVGRQVLQVHPLAIFLGIAFWAWLWGPLGAFLATPILIVARVAFDHLYPHGKAELPG